MQILLSVNTALHICTRMCTNTGALEARTLKARAKNAAGYQRVKKCVNLGWVAGVAVVQVSDLAAGAGAVAVYLLYSHTECNNMHICANIIIPIWIQYS